MPTSLNDLQFEPIKSDFDGLGFEPEKPTPALKTPSPPAPEPPKVDILPVEPAKTPTLNLPPTDKPMGVKEFFKDEAKPIQLVPFLGSGYDSAQAIGLLQSAKRFKAGNATESDEALLTKHFKDSKRGKTFWAGVANVLWNQPAFWGELVATAGIGKLGFEVGKKAAFKVAYKLIDDTAEKVAKKTATKLAGRVAGGIAGSALQAPVSGATRIPGLVAQRMMPEGQWEEDEDGNVKVTFEKDGEPLITALPKGVVDNFVEVASERSGLFLGDAAKKAFSFLPGGKKLAAMSRVAREWIASKQNRSVRDFFKVVADKTQFHGVIAEMGEERFGEILRPILIEGDEYQAPTVRQLATEAVAFAIPGAAKNVIGLVAGAKKKTEERQVVGLSPPEEEKPTPDEVASAKTFFKEAMDKGWMDAESRKNLDEFSDSATAPELEQIVSDIYSTVLDNITPTAKPPTVPEAPQPPPVAQQPAPPQAPPAPIVQPEVPPVTAPPVVPSDPVVDKTPFDFISGATDSQGYLDGVIQAAQELEEGSQIRADEGEDTLIWTVKKSTRKSGVEQIFFEDNSKGEATFWVEKKPGGKWKVLGRPEAAFHKEATIIPVSDVQAAPTPPPAPIPVPAPPPTLQSESGVVDTIAGRMDLTEFEAKGYAPEQVTKADWVNLQRAERRRLGQSEQSGPDAAPYSDYTSFHEQAVRNAVARGEEVDEQVLRDYPELQPAQEPEVTPKTPKPTEAPEPTEAPKAPKAPRAVDDLEGITGEEIDNLLEEASPEPTTPEPEPEPVVAPQPPPAPAPVPAPPTPPAASGEIRKGEVGGMLSSGEVVLTSSGRKTTPFPRIDTSNNRKAINTDRRVTAWLRENALAEAESRGDDFNATQFRAENPKSIPQASKDSMEEYLFGTQPDVPRPLLKPLIPPAAPTSVPPEPNVNTASVDNGTQATSWRAIASSGEVSVDGLGRTEQEAISEARNNFVEAWNERTAQTTTVQPEAALASERAKTINDILLSEQNLMSNAKKAQVIKRMAKKSGKSVKDIQEEIEAAIVQKAHAIANATEIGPNLKFRRLQKLYDAQPVLSARTSTSVEGQAYSTPVPLAYALNYATGVTPQTDVYEPTAGNAMLMIGSNLKASHANEINPVRNANLKKFGVGTVTGNDATDFVPGKKFSDVKANPPFGKTPNVNFDGFLIKKLEHLISLKALNAMKDDGTAAIIIGAKREVGPGGKGAQWIFENYLYSRYNVVANFEVAGDLYGKQGAKWPVRVLVINGRRETPLTGELAAKTVARYDNWADVWKEAQRIKDEIERQNTLGPERSPRIPEPSQAGEQTSEGDRRAPDESGESPVRPGSTGERGRDKGRKQQTRRQPRTRVSDKPTGPASEQPIDTVPTDVQPSGGGQRPSTVESGDVAGTQGETDAERGSQTRGREPDTGKLPQQSPVKASDALSDAVKHGGKAAQAAMDGLSALFGKGVSAGLPIIDEETYRKAKPHFEQLFKDAKAAKHSLGDFFRAVIKEFGDAIKPYIKRFVQDKQAELKKPKKAKKKFELEGDGPQVAYQPHSNAQGMGTILPRNIAQGMYDFLDKIEKKEGPVDEYVADRLNMQVEEVRSVLGAEQVDGVAMAIYQIEHGGALIIGDQTGIGKGRQAAAIIRYAILQGKVPVFFTKDPKLFSDMYGDLRDINTQISPLLFGDKVKASIVDSSDAVVFQAPKTLNKQRKEMAKVIKQGIGTTKGKSGYNVIFSTYSQINKRNDRQRFFEELAEDNPTIVILDESHESSGDADKSMQAAFMTGGAPVKGKGADAEAIPVPGLLNAKGTKLKGGGGVVYLSATYAKRPENMAIYYRTALSKAADSFKEIVDAIERGGVALQQAVSEALAKAGQYIRREREFKGVSYDMVKVKVADEEKLKADVDQVTDVLSEIVIFSHKAVEAIKAALGSTGTAQTQNQIDATEFAAIVHNQVGQLLLGAKADSVVQEAIEAKKRGEKPVIALMNTMESFLKQYVEEHDIKPGAKVDIRWNELLKFALSRTLRASEKLPNGDTVTHTVTPDEIGMRDEYDAIIASANEVEVPFPISPIDYIIQKLDKAGVKMAELTGRSSGIDYTNLETGEGKFRRFQPANKNKVVNSFNTGRVDGMLLNASGSTGLSAHASEKKEVTDKRPRHMLIAQAALDINVFVQTLGRIFRTGLVQEGIDAKGKPYGARYSHMVLPLQAELRPAAKAAQKMKSLNANTTAEAESAIKIDSEDIFNKYGNLIAANILDQNPQLQRDVGIPIETRKDGTVIVPDGVAAKLTGRAALRPDAEQKRIYDALNSDYRDLINQLKATGEFDLEIVVHDDWDGVRKTDEELVPGTNENNIFTASVRVQEWDIADKRHTPTGEEMEKEFIKGMAKHEVRGQAPVKTKEDAVKTVETAWKKFQEDTLQRFRNRHEQINKSLDEERVKAAAEEKNQVGYYETRLRQNQAAFDRWKNTRRSVQRAVSGAGQVVELENTEIGSADEAMLVDIKFPTEGRVAPSAFRMKYLTYRPGGVAYVTALSLRPDKFVISDSRKTASDLVPKKTDTREDRFFIVGNPVRSYIATGGRGKMVRFKSRDGDTVTGLQMPSNWTPANLAQDPRKELINGAAVESFLRNTGSGVKVEIGNLVNISRLGSGSNFAISTSSARSTGGKVYLNEKLADVAGVFTKVGTRMRATIGPESIAPAADIIQSILSGRFRAESTVKPPIDVIPSVKTANEKNRKSIGGAVDNPISKKNATTAALETLGVDELPENVEFIDDVNQPKGSVTFETGDFPQITINLAKHDSSESVKDTLIHELLHPVQENPALANAVGAVADMVSASDLARKQALGYNAAETPIEAANELIRKFYADHAQSNRFKRSIDNVIIWVKRALGVDLTARQAAIWLVRDAVKNNISTATGEAKSIGEVRPEDVGGGTVGAVFEKAISEEFNRPTEFAEADVADDAAAIRGGAYTAAELAEIGLPTVEFETEKHTRMLEGSAWESADEETGGRLLQKHQFLMDHSQEMFPNDAERAAVLGNWVNSLRNILGTMAERRANGMPVPFSEALQDELRGYVQAEARFWGQLLNSLRGVSKSILWAATSSGAKLRTMRSEAFGGQAVNQYLQLIKEHFQETWTDDQIDSLVRETNLLNRLRPVHEITSKQAVKLVRDTLRTPVRHVDEFAEVFSELFAAQFGIPVSPRVAEVFKTAVGKRLTKALKMSKEGAWARLDKKVKKALNKRSPLWRRISRLLDDGDLDFDKAIEAIARREGWVVPTIEDIDQFKALAARERELRTLKPDVIENIDKLPKSKRAAEKRRLQDELEAATDTSRSDIIKRMNNTWSRWTRPISWAAYLPWKFRLETVQNNAQAVNEWITANLLLKFGFAVRQVIDVGVQTISHDPTRALGTAMLTHQDDFAKGVFTPAFWADAGSALSTALRLRIKTTKHAIAAAKQALKGKGVIKHSEQVTNRLDIFERMLRKAEKLSDEGKNVQAFGLRLAAWMRSALLFSRAMDLLSTTGATYVEIAHRIRISMREQGKSRAEIEVQLDGIFGNMRAQWIDAYARAEQVFAAYGEDPNKADLDNAAGNIMRSRAYGALKIIDSKSDDFKSVAEYMASTIGWNEREAAGIGGMVAGILRTVQRGGESIGVPTAFISAFGNAIGIGINRKLTWMGLGKFAQINGQNPWFRTELDQQQRQVEGFIGAGLSSVLVALVMTGAIVVRGFWPRDEKEREKWRIEGRRPGTIEIPTGEDGEFFAVSLSVGPAALVAPSLVAAGELKKKIDEQTEKQAKLDADAKKRGMKPGKVDPLNAADMLEVAGSAMWASLMNSRTAGGLAGAFMQEGLFETKRFGATIVTDVTPGLPAWKDAMRAAGVYMNGRLATFGDMIFPTPWSGARRVTVLGDPSGSFDQVQQIVQTLSGGTAPGKVNPRLARNKPAYEALFSANWVPSPPNPARGYAIDRVYRPLTRPEMQRYTGLRADFFAKALAPVAPQIIALPQEQGEKIARKAFEDANNRALTAIGVDVQASSAPSSRPKSSQTIQVGKPISFRPRLSRPRLSRAVPKSPFGKLPGLSAVPSLKPVPVPRGATSPRLRTSRIRKPRVRKPSSSVKVRRGSLRRRVRLPRATVSRRR